jgi:hypothetical protein
MDVPNREFVLAGSLEELKAKGRSVVHGGHRPILVIYHRGRVFALDNRCPHMGFPLERGSVEDGILTCHWHHARSSLRCRSLQRALLPSCAARPMTSFASKITNFSGLSAPTTPISGKFRIRK